MISPSFNPAFSAAEPFSTLVITALFHDLLSEHRGTGVFFNFSFISFHFDTHLSAFPSIWSPYSRICWPYWRNWKSHPPCGSMGPWGNTLILGDLGSTEHIARTFVTIDHNITIAFSTGWPFYFHFVAINFQWSFCLFATFLLNNDPLFLFPLLGNGRRWEQNQACQEIKGNCFRWVFVS